MTEFIRRIINFGFTDWAIVQQAAKEKGLGDKGYSAIIRLIIREWAKEHLPSAPGYTPEPPTRTM